MNIKNYFENCDEEVKSRLATVKKINVEEGTNKYSFDGKFKSLFEATQKQKVGLLTNNSGDIIGINYDSGAGDTVEDNLAAKAFIEAYAYKPVMDYMHTIIYMISMGIEPTYINEDTSIYGNIYIYDGKQKKLLISSEDGLKTHYEEISSEEELVKYIQRNERYEDYDEDEDGEERKTEKEPPKELEIDVNDLGGDISEKSVKTYLREKYGRYLAKGNKLNIIEGDHHITADNIKWGRKM